MRQVGIIAVMIVVGILTMWGLLCISPNYSIVAERRTSFILPKSFNDVKKSILQGHFETEILKVNNASMISKTWHNADLYLHNPFSRDRYIEFNGEMTAKVSVDHPKAGQIIVYLRHRVYIAKESVEIHAHLDRPLDVGVTDLNEEIKVRPNGDQTLVELHVRMRLQRIVPSFAKDFAQNEMENAANMSVANLQAAFQNLPPPRGWLGFPLPFIDK